MSEYYITGGDAYFPLNLRLAAAQTFRPLETHIIQKVSLVLKMWSLGPMPWVNIYYADAHHLPHGDLLSRSISWETPKFWPGQTLVVNFPMQPFTLTYYEYYIIVVRSSPLMWEFPAEWLYDAADAAYPRGHRLSYDPTTEQWTQHYYSDHIFIESGVPPPPPPPTPPPLHHWALLDISIKPTRTNVIISIVTDRPCHLWIRWTIKKPWRHSKPIYRRGVFLKGDLRFCFVEFEELEQEEEGDTLEHTFTLVDWPFCTSRYFYFHGTIRGIDSTSTSPIFDYHRQPLFPVLLFSERWTHYSTPPLKFRLLLTEPWQHTGPPPPFMTKKFIEPWTYFLTFGNLLFEEAWTLYSPPPPELEQVFSEPWTWYSPPPPTLEQLFSEPWTHLTPPPPIMQNLFTEPWTNE